MTKGHFFWILEGIAIFILFVSIFISVSITTRLPFRYQHRASTGKPYIEYQEVEVAGEITSIASDESYLYCCFGKRHIVKLFDFEGQYVSTIAISDTHNQGGTLMVSKEANMVVLFSDTHCYYFDKGNFVSFDPQGNQSKQLRYTSNAADSTGRTYTVQHGYVVRQTTTETASRFVSSPLLLRYLNPNTMSIIMPLLMTCVLILHSVNISGKKR